MQSTETFLKRLALRQQGLLRRGSFGRAKNGAIKAIRSIGYVQIDTISVVERAHHHVIWTRVPGYQPEILDTLQKERHILEYWSHAAAYLPMEHYRYCLPRMYHIQKMDNHWFERNPGEMQWVLDRIRAEGPLMSRDFEGKAATQAMWDLKPVKRAIHELVQMGKLLVSHREGFQKVFDLPERVIPGHIDVSYPSMSEYAEHRIRSALQAHGAMSLQEIAYQRSWARGELEKTFKRMLGEGQLREFQVNGARYVTLETSPLKSIRKPVSPSVMILSPFDNLVIQRKRLQQIFGFDYKTEIYLPKDKRVFGYFSSPLLWGDQLVGRIDPKADRNQKQLLIQNLTFEPKFQPSTPFWEGLQRCLNEFAAFNGCNKIICNQYPHLSQETWPAT